MAVIVLVLFVISFAFVVFAEIHRIVYLARIRQRKPSRIQNDVNALRAIALIYALAGLSCSGVFFLSIFLDQEGSVVKNPENLFSTQVVQMACLISIVSVIGPPIIGYIRFKADILLARKSLEK